MGGIEGTQPGSNLTLFEYIWSACVCASLTGVDGIRGGRARGEGVDAIVEHCKRHEEIKRRRVGGETSEKNQDTT